MIPNKDLLILGIDLGGTKILTSVINPEGEMLSRDHSVTPAAEGPEGVIQAILASAGRALEGAFMAIDRVSAVGVGAPGLADTEAGVLFTSPNLPGWEDVPLRDVIQEKLKKKAFLINDGNAAALGEHYFGAAKGVTHFIYVTISTGIGGGIVIDGKVLNGFKGMAGDIGLFLREQIRAFFSQHGIAVNLRYIDPSYTIRSQPANARDSAYCVLLGHNAVHAGMTGRTEMVVSFWRNEFTHLPIPMAISQRKKIDPDGGLWNSVLASTGQPRDLR